MQSGLHNIGASCWLNSSIQVLYSLIPIGLAMSAMLKSEEYINKIDLYVAVKPGCKKKLFRFADHIFTALLSHIFARIHNNNTGVVRKDHLKYMVAYLQNEQGNVIGSGFEDADEKLIGCFLCPIFYLPLNTNDLVKAQWNKLESQKIPVHLLANLSPGLKDLLTYVSVFQANYY
jgi:hypothetical protein